MGARLLLAAEVDRPHVRPDARQVALLAVDDLRQRAVLPAALPRAWPACRAASPTTRRSSPTGTWCPRSAASASALSQFLFPYIIWQCAQRRRQGHRQPRLGERASAWSGSCPRRRRTTAGPSRRRIATHRARRAGARSRPCAEAAVRPHMSTQPTASIDRGAAPARAAQRAAAGRWSRWRSTRASSSTRCCAHSDEHRAQEPASTATWSGSCRCSWPAASASALRWYHSTTCCARSPGSATRRACCAPPSGIRCDRAEPHR